MSHSHSPYTLSALALTMILTSGALLAQDKDEKTMRSATASGVFKTNAIRFEVNETDQDGEVVINFKAFEGLNHLIVQDPDRNTVVNLKSKDEGNIGLEQGKVETAEPSVQTLLAAYPEGRYTFFGRTVSGQRIYGAAMLTHTVLAAPVFVPRDDQMVDPNNTLVQWAPVSGAANYIIEIKQDDLGFELTATVTSDVLTLAVPPGVLAAGSSYEIAVSTVTAEGNVSVAESTFITMQ